MDKQQLYAIRKLKWKRDFQGWRQCWEADTPFGSFTVERMREEGDDNSPWRPLTWGYCFAEYHDEAQMDCSSVKEGKRLAEEYWRERLLPTLIETQTAQGE